jgi:hypothetical protein
MSESHQQRGNIGQWKMTRYTNFLPTKSKKIKDTEDIPKYSFKFFSTDILSERINVDMYLSGKTSLTL